MIKYSSILDENTGLCSVADGSNVSYYRFIGMVERDVERSEVDYRWYLKEKCPHLTPEKKLQQAKELKYQEANEKARNYLEVGDAVYEFNPTFHVEASKENMNTLATAALAIEKGLIEYQPWTSKEDNQLNLTEMECLTISMGIGQIQSNIWNRQYMGYVTRIDNAQTVAEVNAIEIIYN